MNKTLTIIIPVYYNEDSLPELFCKLSEVEKKLQIEKINLELIFVDDGSTDSSYEKLLLFKKHRKATKIIKLTRNFGVMQATKCSLQFVQGDCFIFLAADLQDPPDIILKMIKKWKAGSKFTIAARTSRLDSLFTELTSKLNYWIIRNFLIANYPKNGFDMALMDRSILPFIKSSARSVFTPFLVFNLGFKPEIIYYQRNKREHGKSRWSFIKRLNSFLDIVLSCSVFPLRFVCLLGFSISALSFIYCFFIVVNGLISSFNVPGFATIAALISFFSGFMILILGIIGEYLWRIFQETNKTIDYVIEKII